MGFVSSVTTQIVITGVLIGVARRVGLISINPRVIKSETTRKAFEVGPARMEEEGGRREGRCNSPAKKKKYICIYIYI